MQLWAQAPAERFHAGVAVDFCPELALRKPLCAGVAALETSPLPNNHGVLLKAVSRLPTTWFVFQNRPAFAMPVRRHSSCVAPVWHG